MGTSLWRVFATIRAGDKDTKDVVFGVRTEGHTRLPSAVKAYAAIAESERLDGEVIIVSAVVVSTTPVKIGWSAHGIEGVEERPREDIPYVYCELSGRVLTRQEVDNAI